MRRDDHLQRGPLVFGFLISASVLVGCIVAPPPQSVGLGDAATGREVAEDMCAGCHALEEAGTDPDRNAPSLREVLAGFPVDQLETTLRNSEHISYLNMPRFNFGDRQAEDLIAYIRTINSD